MSLRNYHTVFHGLPFLNAVNILASVTQLTRPDQDAATEVGARIFSGLFMLVLIYVMANWLGKRSRSTGHHADCICRYCQRAWIPIRVRREFPWLKSSFTIANYVAFSISLVDMMLRQGDPGFFIRYTFYSTFIALALLFELVIKHLCYPLTDPAAEFVQKRT